MKKTIEDLKLEGKKVLLRVDFNVPIKDGKITDDKRIVASLETIKYLLKQNAAVIVCSHLGRPNGVDPKLSLKPVAKRLGELLKKRVIFATDVVSKDAKEKAKNLKPGSVLVLENLRFEKGETKNDEKLAQKLAKFADIYVSDAFAASHRAHASTVGVAKLLPNAVGFLMDKEITTIGETLKNPERPFVAILGGSKVGDKIGLVTNLLSKVGTIIIGGAMAFTFIKALGGNVGKSLVEVDKIEVANKILAKAKNKGVNILLPVDCVCAKELAEKVKTKTFQSFHIPEDYAGYDIGKKSIKIFKSALKKAKTVIWNGPVGAFEFSKFEKGTKALAKAVVKVDGKVIVGGGDSAAALAKFGLDKKVTHLSTGGGASLEFMEGKTLPGVEVIENKTRNKK